MNAMIHGRKGKREGLRPLAQILATLPLQGQGLLRRLQAEWALIAGEDIAARATPCRLTPQGSAGGAAAVSSRKSPPASPPFPIRPQHRQPPYILYLDVKDASAILLQHEAPRLIARINGYFGRSLIVALRLRRVS